MDEIRLIIAGTRDFDDYSFLCKKVDEIIGSCKSKHPAAAIVVVSGTARGADLLGERYAKEHGYRVRRFPADWKLYGKQAGFVRNRQMLDFAKERNGILVAFWDGFSRGTKNMIEISESVGLDVRVIRF